MTPAPVMVLVALLCLLSQLSTSLHMTLVEHVHCAEHDAWVHADDHASPHAVGTTVTTAHATPGVTTSSTDESDHGHCLVLAERRDAAPVVAQCVSALPLQIERPESKLAAQTSYSRAVYCFAPKTSPPV